MLPRGANHRERDTEGMEPPMPIQCTCQQCGTTYFRNPSEVGPVCSRRCSAIRGAALSIRQISLPCAQCGVEFACKQSELRYGRTFCSNACRITARRAVLIPLTCEQCGRTFFRKPSGVGPVCSHACRILRRAAADREDPEIRFPRHVARIDDADSCWLWTGTHRKPTGYGNFGIGRDGRGMVGAHVYALELRLGRRLMRGEHSLHTCDVQLCVRNDGGQGVYIVDGKEYVRFGHLWSGSHAANMADMINKGRHNSQTHLS